VPRKHALHLVHLNPMRIGGAHDVRSIAAVITMAGIATIPVAP
jgi:L-alanine-DL-glutamate epimerase-like enolase superfamily enzyme